MLLVQSLEVLEGHMNCTKGVKVSSEMSETFRNSETGGSSVKNISSLTQTHISSYYQAKLLVEAVLGDPHLSFIPPSVFPASRAMPSFIQLFFRTILLRNEYHTDNQ